MTRTQGGGPAAIQIVVGAAIIRGGELLAAQRADPPQLRGRWELPGGKVDPGEADTEALVRECREELGVEIALGARLGGDVAMPVRPGAVGAVLRVWAARVVEGEPRPLEHMALRWLGPEALDEVDWLPADVPFLDAVRPLLQSDGQRGGNRGGNRDGAAPTR
nr:(deoxy)nucleoside triphosphate pyrophosphohydrolase [Nocardiopsis baichengensis]